MANSVGSARLQYGEYLELALNAKIESQVVELANELLAPARPVRDLGNFLLDVCRRSAINGSILAKLFADDAAGKGDILAEGNALLCLANVSIDLIQYSTAFSFAQRAKSLFMECGNEAKQGAAENALGRYFGNCNDFASARDHYERALELFIDAGDQDGKLIALSNIAANESQLGRHASAISISRAAAEQARSAGAHFMFVNATNVAAVSTIALGELRVKAGDLQEAQGHFRDAIALLQSSLALCLSLKIRHQEARALLAMAVAQLGLGRLDEATANNDHGLALARTLSLKKSVCDGMTTGALILLERGEVGAGLHQLRLSRRFAVNQLGAQDQEARIAELLAKHYEKAGRLRTARRYARRAQEIHEFIQLGIAMRVEKARNERTTLHEISIERTQYRENLRKTEVALAHAARVSTSGEMAAGIAHEISQPLTAVLSSVQAARNLLEAAQLNVDAIKAALAVTESAAKRTVDVTKRFRAFFSNRELTLSKVSINELIGNSLALSQWQLNSARVNVDSVLAPGIPTILADPILLTQVIVNLIANAADAVSQMPAEHRVIEITTEMRDDYVVFRVIDHGHGFSAQAVPRVFTQFHSTKATGMGLGLSLCRSIIEAHDGTIDLVSPAGPTEFLIKLPVKHAT